MNDPAIEPAALELFERYLDIAEGEREAWIDAQTAGQPELRARFDEILIADRHSLLMTGGGSRAIGEDIRPERIGAYAIVGKIGSGGMGTVYHGARDTGDFAHDVAIKLIKPGVLSERLIERFRSERQTLAQLRHPNIAQLYDGGETVDGSPYIVMELVEGQPLLDWAEGQRLSAHRRAALASTIARAVGFAHRNLVVHRDITPTNVLVTADGTPKLIDFGIAKPVEEDALADAERLSVGSLSLTPGYAAPERMQSAQVTTAADIYSIGKLLAALLDKPDTDVASIVARATATDPADRYPSADGLADDIDAWCSGFPVAARGGSWRYRARRFVARNRAASGVAAAATIGLIVAFALTIAAYQRAEHARAAEAARFAQLRSLANYMLFDLNGRLARVTGNVDARVDLANRAQSYLSTLAAAPDSSAPLRHEVARGFIALAMAQGVPTQPNLGQPELARANLLRAKELLTAPDQPAALVAPDLVEARAAFAMIQAHIDAKIEDADRTLAAADTILMAVPIGSRTERWFLAQRRLRYAQIEMTTIDQRPDEMLRLASEIESAARQWPAAMRQRRELAIDRAFVEYYRGLHGYFTDALPAAITSLRRSEQAFEALDAEVPNDPLILAAQMWASYVGYGAAAGLPARADEATSFLARAIRTSDRIIAIEPRDNGIRSFAGNLRQARSQSLSAQGDHVGAVAIQREVIALYRAGLGPERQAVSLNRLASAHIVMSNIARTANDRALACDSYRNASVAILELSRRAELLGSVGSNREVLDENLDLCTRGIALSQMAALK
jgi:eukaryotic-like serine/threonine-protein kinase